MDCTYTVASNEARAVEIAGREFLHGPSQSLFSSVRNGPVTVAQRFYAGHGFPVFGLIDDGVHDCRSLHPEGTIVLIRKSSETWRRSLLVVRVMAREGKGLGRFYRLLGCVCNHRWLRSVCGCLRDWGKIAGGLSL